MSARLPVTLAEARSIPLEPDPLEEAAIVSGSPVTTSATISVSAGGAETGVWRCEPGTFTDVEVEEVFVVLAGRATVEHEGTSYELGPGTVCAFAAGAETTWIVHETILKVYVVEPAADAG